MFNLCFTEIAEVVTFLASEKSSYITGTSIAVSGGYWNQMLYKLTEQNKMQNHILFY